MPGTISHWILESLHFESNYSRSSALLLCASIKSGKATSGRLRHMWMWLRQVMLNAVQLQTRVKPHLPTRFDAFVGTWQYIAGAVVGKRQKKNFFFLLTNGIVLKKLVICTHHVQSLPRNLKDKDASVGPVPWWSTATPPLFEKRPAYREALKIVSRRPEESRHQVSWRPFPDPLREILPPFGRKLLLLFQEAVVKKFIAIHVSGYLQSQQNSCFLKIIENSGGTYLMKNWESLLPSSWSKSQPFKEKAFQRTWWERMQKLKPLSSKNLWPSTANSKKILPFYAIRMPTAKFTTLASKKKKTKHDVDRVHTANQIHKKRLHGTFRWCLGQSWWPYFRGWTCRNLLSLGGDHRKTLKWESKSPECRDIENHILYLDLWKHISSGLVFNKLLDFHPLPNLVMPELSTGSAHCASNRIFSSRAGFSRRFCRSPSRS